VVEIHEFHPCKGWDGSSVCHCLFHFYFCEMHSLEQPSVAFNLFLAFFPYLVRFSPYLDVEFLLCMLHIQCNIAVERSCSFGLLACFPGRQFLSCGSSIFHDYG